MIGWIRKGQENKGRVKKKNKEIYKVISKDIKKVQVK